MTLLDDLDRDLLKLFSYWQTGEEEKYVAERKSILRSIILRIRNGGSL